MLIFSFIALLPFVLAQDFPNPLSYYVNNKVLVDGSYKIYWNYTKTDIIGEIHVKTIGWIGFGISPNGGMAGSDVFVAWIDSNGLTNFTDRYITSDRRVLVDNEQNWFLLGSLKSNGFTIIKFTRKIETCDAYEQDLTIPMGTVRVILAWNDQLPAKNGDISYHGFNNRATRSLLLLNSYNQELKIASDDALETYSFTVNVR